MSELSAELKEHLAQGATTLCSAWQLILRDGTIILMTDHDEPLEIDGKTYHPNQSLNDTDRDHRLNFAADGGAIQTVFDLPSLDAASVKSGGLDGAELLHLKVNWRAPEQYYLVASGRIGPVKVTEYGFEAEWLGHATKLDRHTGRVFSKLCDASFGDDRCGLSAEGFPEGTTCPRTLNACRMQFDNANNFRGFPYLLGDDALQAAPQIGQARNGGSRYRASSVR